MHGLAKACALGLGFTMALGACDVGEGGTPDDDDELPFERIEGGPDDGRLDTLGIVCESILTVTGTYTETTPPPAGKSGCWDVGIWTVTDIAFDFEGCAPNPEFLETYTFEARRDDEDQADTTIIYTDDPDHEEVNLKITTAGDSLCHGSFSIFYDDNTELTISPTLQLDGTLSGGGVFLLHEENPF